MLLEDIKRRLTPQAVKIRTGMKQPALHHSFFAVQYNNNNIIGGIFLTITFDVKVWESGIMILF